MITNDKMNLSESLNRLQESQKPAGQDLASEKEPESQVWDLNTNFKSARNLAHVGWLEKADELWKYISVLAPKVEYGILSRYETSGDCVDVGRYLSNEPECMIDTTITPETAVKVYVNISAAASVNAKYIFNRGIALAAIIHALQSSGRSVSLVVGESVSRGNDRHETFINIQDFGEYINPARLAFWLAHPAALRRCIFRYNEQQSNEIRNRIGFKDGSGYGRPEDFTGEEIPKDAVVLPYLNRNDDSKYGNPLKAMHVLVESFKEKGVPISVEIK